MMTLDPGSSSTPPWRLDHRTHWLTPVEHPCVEVDVNEARSGGHCYLPNVSGDKPEDKLVS